MGFGRVTVTQPTCIEVGKKIIKGERHTESERERHTQTQTQRKR